MSIGPSRRCRLVRESPKTMSSRPCRGGRPRRPLGLPRPSQDWAMLRAEPSPAQRRPPRRSLWRSQARQSCAEVTPLSSSGIQRMSRASARAQRPHRRRKWPAQRTPDQKRSADRAEGRCPPCRSSSFSQPPPPQPPPPQPPPPQLPPPPAASAAAAAALPGPVPTLPPARHASRRRSRAARTDPHHQPDHSRDDRDDNNTHQDARHNTPPSQQVPPLSALLPGSFRAPTPIGTSSWVLFLVGYRSRRVLVSCCTPPQFAGQSVVPFCFYLCWASWCRPRPGSGSPTHRHTAPTGAISAPTKSWQAIKPVSGMAAGTLRAGATGARQRCTGHHSTHCATLDGPATVRISSARD